MSNPNAPAPAPRWIRWIGLMALLLYGVYLGRLFNPIATAADASGYLNSAKLLTEGKLVTTSRAVPGLTLRDTFHYVPLGFTNDPARPATRLAPTYPVGMPLQFAAVSAIAGWTVGPYIVGVGGALLAIWLCYLLAREIGVSPVLALAGAAALACSPVFIFIGIQPLSDVVATTWTLAAGYAALRARRDGARGWALACGTAGAIAVLVRPSNIIVLPAIALLAGRWRSLPWIALAGLPWAIGLLAYQQHLYGHALQSGYGGIFHLFWLHNFPLSLRHYGVWLPALVCPVFGLLLLAGPARGARATWLALVLWGGSIAIFYAFYDVTSEDWYCLRFLLPAFPPLIVAALSGFERLVQSLPPATAGPHRAWFALLVLGWTAATAPYFGKKLGVTGPAVTDRDYFEAVTWMRAHLEPSAVVASMVGSGTLYFYTDYPILRWDFMTAADTEDYAKQLRAAHRPLYALLFEPQEAEAIGGNLSGPWRRIARFNGASVWQWQGPS